ncbi:SIS domain-containing protein [Deinococcus detaillensis]|nr:phosphosugar isomerase [Deinococcus detaillensis]
MTVMHTPTSTDAPSGLDLIRWEQSRQVADAHATWNDPAQQHQAQQIAEALRQPGASLLLLGMGASHHANSAALAAYRSVGITALALSLDEALSMPLPPSAAQVTLLVSQSGESGELRTFLEAASTDRGPTFGLSLSPDSYLVRQLPSLVAAGGPEVGFAATRSYLLTLVLHRLILRAYSPEAAHTDLPALDGEALDFSRFGQVRSMVFAGSGALAGLAAMAALGTIELGRFPALHYDLGQLRHGPLELLTPETGIVLLRRSDETDYERQTAESILKAAQAAGCLSLSLVAEVSALPLGLLTAPLKLCLPVQQLVIDLALQRVERVGEPVRSSKVTR